MDSKKLYDFLFQLFDYADYLVEEINPNNPDNNNYFISLVYIEDIMDKYGRGLISKTGRELNPEDTESLEEAHRKIDFLRKKINALKTAYDFNGVVINRTESLIRDWDRISS